MGIKIVREESDTPNIKNTDDFVSIRYAYGNQNGYVIDKGNELDITQVDAKNINIGSGRLVVQGVEVDIDANGVNVGFDDLSQTGDVYVSVYCKVNVALNEVVVEKMFDMVDYPVIEEGDDLTEKSSGIANIILAYVHFQNGSILSIEKKVNAIQYTSGITVENSKKVNNLEIKKDENGVLKIGDVIIPQKKLLWSGEIKIGASNPVSSKLICTIPDFTGEKTLEVVVQDVNWDKSFILKFKISKKNTDISLGDGLSTRGSTTYIRYLDYHIGTAMVVHREINVSCRGNSLENNIYASSYTVAYNGTMDTETTGDPKYVTEVYEIIE